MKKNITSTFKPEHRKSGVTGKSNNVKGAVRTAKNETGTPHKPIIVKTKRINVQRGPIKESRPHVDKLQSASSQPSLMLDLAALRQAIASDGGEHRANYRRNLAQAYELAFHMNLDFDCKLEFESSPEWEVFADTRISRKDPTSLLAAVLGYLFGNRTRLKRQKVSKLKKALEPYFIRCISPIEVRALILKRGVPGLMSNAFAISGNEKQNKNHSKNNSAGAVNPKFYFNPGKCVDQLTRLTSTLVAQGRLKLVPKSNGEVEVKLLSLNATAQR